MVKDFSRFSRDYIDLGTYIEQIFPFMKVRFISINDCYDSDDKGRNRGNLDIAFKHLLYDLYSKDLSIKVKSSLEMKKKQGLYISGNCPFGYEKMPGNRHMLVIAEDEAQVVRKIFNLSAKGLTSSQIAKYFNEEQIKTPIQFKAEKGRTTRTPKGKKFVWEHTMICAILRNRVYAGDMVYGKYERLQVGGKNRQKPKEEWRILENHHEPIIERELFESVQKQRNLRIDKKKEKSHPLTGKLVCGCCGHNLIYRKNRRNPYFYCNSRYTNGMKECVSQLNAMYIQEVVLYQAQQRFDRLVKTEQAETVKGLIKQEEEQKKNRQVEKGNQAELRSECIGGPQLPQIYELTEEMVSKLLEQIVVRKNGRTEIFWKGVFALS